MEGARPGMTPEGEGGDPVVNRVRALLQLAVQYSVAELSIEAGDFKLSLRTHPGHTPALQAAPPVDPAADMAPAAATADDEHIITAPMIGTFYEAPAPGEPPFVNVGDVVEVGQTVAIIEAMKIMNEIQSDVAGTMVEVLARNGHGVEFGQPLFRIKRET